MSKFCAVLLVLCSMGICAAQSTATTEQTPKQFRLTFVLTYPQNQQPSQSFILDVPVLPDHPGMSGMSMVGGSTGLVAGGVQENLQCTDVHESVTGLAAKVTFSMDSVPSEPLPGFTDLRHRQLRFERQIDLILGKPTTITEKMHVISLGKTSMATALKLAGPSPEITVTAVEM